MNYLVSDEQYVLLAHRNIELAFNCLSRRYLSFAKMMINQFILQKNTKYINSDECYHLYYESMWKAIKNYQKSVIPFFIFFKKVYIRDLNNSFNKIINENKNMFNAVYLDYAIDDNTPIIDIFSVETEDCIEKKSRKDAINLRLSSTNKEVTKYGDLQKQMIVMKLEGYTLSEISKHLNLNLNVVRRILKNDEHGSPLADLKEILK